MAKYNKTRKIRGGVKISGPAVSSGPAASSRTAPAGPTVTPEAAVQTLLMNLMRNPTVTGLVPRVQSTVVGIVNNSAIVSPILNILSPFLTNSLISVLKDPGVKAALTKALADIK